MVWGLQTNSINRVILASWRTSGHQSDQQLSYSYMCDVVIYLQLSISYLSSVLEPYYMFMINKVFVFRPHHLSSCTGGREGQL